MSTISKTKCDFCKKETSDYYSEINWIRIKTSGGYSSIIITNGRKEDKTSKIKKHIPLSPYCSLDFCCLECLANFLGFESLFNLKAKQIMDLPAEIRESYMSVIGYLANKYGLYQEKENE